MSRSITRATPDATYAVEAHETPDGLRYGIAERLYGAFHFYSVMWEGQKHPFASRYGAQLLVDELQASATGKAPMTDSELQAALARDAARTAEGTKRRVKKRTAPLPDADYLLTYIKMSDGSMRYGVAERKHGSKTVFPVLWHGRRYLWLTVESAKRGLYLINQRSPLMCW